MEAVTVRACKQKSTVGTGFFAFLIPVIFLRLGERETFLA